MTNADRTEIKNFVKAVRVEQDRRNAAKFVEDEAGKSLVSDTEITRLAGMETGAQVNKIEVIEIDGVVQTVDTDTKTISLNLSDYAKKDEVSDAAALHYKGSKDTFAALPATGNKNGDVWNIKIAGGTDRHGVEIKAGDNVVYVVDTDVPAETGWDVQGGTADLSGYLTAADYKSVLDDLVAGSSDTFTVTDITDIFTDN